ncbi:MAG: hypothetical protein M1840_002431 [Geoglossum simile]|nr:MAG: hypothetical protein M1840_002431 [Geoglossum simile]
MASFPSTIVVTNNLPFAIDLEGDPVTRGHWVVEPPHSIAAGSTTGSFRVEDDPRNLGTDGSFVYSLPVPGMDKQMWTVNFSCIPLEENVAEFVVDTPILFNVLDSFNKGGESLMLHLVIEFKPLISKVSITRLTLQNPNTPIKNSKDVVSFGSSVAIWSTSTASSVADNTTPGVHGSYKPVAFDLNAPSADLRIELSSDPSLADIPFQLTGVLDGARLVVVERTFQGTAINAKISARFQEIVWGYAGDIQWSWTFTPAGRSISIGQTRVELYGLSSSLPPFLQTNGIPVELLRQTALSSPGVGYKTYIGRLLMNHFAYKYDTHLGAPRFVSSVFGEEFRLDYWVAMIRHEPAIGCNGSDQAGLLQVVLSLQEGSPREDSWALMTPFGYFNKTRLIGWELCNNPFFKDEAERKLLDQEDKKRTQFSSHSFIKDNGRILDSCLGPHRGFESPSLYAMNAVDSDTSLYGPTGTKPGTEGDISLHKGISSLVAGSTFDPKSDFLGSLPLHFGNAIKKALDRAATPNPPAAKYSNADMSDIASLIGPAFNGELSHHSTDISSNGSESRYIFKLADGMIELRIRLCVDHDAAVAVFQRHLSAYQAFLPSIFKGPSEKNAKGQLNLEADGHSIWVRDNGFFIVTAVKPGDPLDVITAKIDAYFAAASVDRPDVGMPDHWKPAHSLEYPVGTRFVVKPQINSSDIIVASTTTGNVILLSSSNSSRISRFLASAPGTDEITLTYAHKKTLAIVVERVKVNVTGRAQARNVQATVGVTVEEDVEEED